MPTIKLKANDEEEHITVDVEVACCSQTVKDMLDNLGTDDTDDEVIPIEKVNNATLKKIIEWATYHKDDPPPPAENDNSKKKRTDDICAWDAEFMNNIDQSMMFDLMLAANFLDIQGLLDLTCKTLTNMIKGKSPKDIRKTFNVKDGLSTATAEKQKNESCEKK